MKPKRNKRGAETRLFSCCERVGACEREERNGRGCFCVLPFVRSGVLCGGSGDKLNDKTALSYKRRDGSSYNCTWNYSRQKL